jgi:hypothetical protein
MMRVLLIGLFFAPIFAVSAFAGDGGGGGDVEAEFDTPSHNMCCHYIPEGGTSVYTTPDGSAEMICQREKPQYWTVSLTALGKLKVDKHPGEQAGCGGTNVIEYGETRHDGPFTCISSTSGITCVVNGRGFSLAKSGLKKIH